MEEFGILRFETEVLSGPGQPPKYVMLNRNQVGIVIALSRNTKEVVRFKVDLFHRIDAMEKQLASAQSPDVAALQQENANLRQVLAKLEPMVLY